MNNFTYYTPTKLVFGKNAIQNLPELLSHKGKRVLLTYGGGSIKKNGLYNTILDLLKNFEVFELSGIKPNPEYSTSVLDGIRLCKENKIDVVLAVGGGSVLDCSKAICAGACYEGEAWDLIASNGRLIEKALPLVTVLTLAATGSEYDNGGVISKIETKDKESFGHPACFPYASILDPTYTFSVSRKQTAAGTADAINHVMEQYFAKEHTILTDGMMEATIRSLIQNGHKALKNPEDYEARAELMVDCSLACNGILSIGAGGGGWPCHGIEHALSGYYDITHGEGLAIVTPRWMKYILNENTVERFVSFGKGVFGMNQNNIADMTFAQMVIDETYKMFADFGCPMTLKEVGIGEECLHEMAHHIAENEGLDQAWAPLKEEDIYIILKNCL